MGIYLKTAEGEEYFSDLLKKINGQTISTFMIT
jgi:hypothetical protein